MESDSTASLTDRDELDHVDNQEKYTMRSLLRFNVRKLAVSLAAVFVVAFALFGAATSAYAATAPQIQTYLTPARVIHSPQGAIVGYDMKQINGLPGLRVVQTKLGTLSTSATSAGGPQPNLVTGGGGGGPDPCAGGPGTGPAGVCLELYINWYWNGSQFLCGKMISVAWSNPGDADVNLQSEYYINGVEIDSTNNDGLGYTNYDTICFTGPRQCVWRNDGAASARFPDGHYAGPATTDALAIQPV